MARVRFSSPSAAAAPNGAHTSPPAGAVNEPIWNAGNPRTYMLGIPASQLAGIPAGAVINGVSLRSSIPSSNPASWPPSDTTWTDYEVTVGSAIPPAPGR